MLQDRYELHERLGAGGMAKVYRAFDHSLSRSVALKMLHDDLVENEEIRQRFLREARVFARLRHPNIVEIHDVVQDEKAAVMVMEFVEGTDLSHLARRQPLRVPELAIALLRPVMDALRHAHAEGVIHRDVKPGNILLSVDGRVKLGDFGIAKVLAEANLTHTGEFLGTPAYIAPEQARGEEITPAVDQYALGVVLYELLAGRPPYTGPTPLAVLSQILIGKFPEVRTLNEGVSEPLAALVHRALSAHPQDRFPDMTSFIAAVDAVSAPLSTARERELVSGLTVDPAATVEAMAKAAAEDCLTTARRAIAEGDLTSARTAARQALVRVPEHPEAREMLDTLRQSMGELRAIRPSAGVNADDAPASEPRVATGRWKLGLGAAFAGLLAAVGLITLFREPPPAPATEVAVAVARPPALAVAMGTPAPVLVPTPSAAPGPAPVSAALAPSAPTGPPTPAVATAVRARPTPAAAAPDPKRAVAPATAAPEPDDSEPPRGSAPPREGGTSGGSSPAAPASGTLRIITQPWAEVELDGRALGRTPYFRESVLPAGRHRLLLRNPGFPPHEETLTLDAGQTLVRRINLAVGAEAK